MNRIISGPVVLVVLDGWGLREDREHNAIAQANTPFYDHLVKTFPFTKLHASGEAVGLPEGQIGNSEVGHMTIGAGCIRYQDLVRINKDIESGSFHTNEAFMSAFNHVKENNSTLHILGLLSPGGVHGHEDHLIETIHAAKSKNVLKIVLHVFLDGRDSPKKEGLKSLEKLEQVTDRVENCAVGSVTGRYFSMDRNTNWYRTNKAFQAIFQGKAEHVYERSIRPSRVIREMYHRELYDEHMEPVVFTDEDNQPYIVRENDAIVFTNFRKDRVRQLSRKICDQTEVSNILFVTMTDYGKEIDAIVAYKPKKTGSPLSEIISQAGMKQVHIAETEKFPHATYYINGGNENAYPGEEDVLIPSRKDIKTHDEAPEMRAKEITDEALKRINKTDFMFINYANPDMVGHTAHMPAIVKAVETVDRELKRLTDRVLKQNGALLIIADHGNAETVVNPETGEPHTAHTTNPVPCILIHDTLQLMLRSGNTGLQDVAPTILELLGLGKSASMTGESLLISG